MLPHHRLIGELLHGNTAPTSFLRPLSIDTEAQQNQFNVPLT